MAIYVYDKATGELRGYIPDDKDDGPGQVPSQDELDKKGYALVKGLEPLDDTHAWDAATKAVIEVQAPIKPHIIDNFQFVLSFTPQEYDGLVKSDDIVIHQLIEALRVCGTIDLNGTTTGNGIGYAVSIGLLKQDRADAILAGS